MSLLPHHHPSLVAVFPLRSRKIIHELVPPILWCQWLQNLLLAGRILKVRRESFQHHGKHLSSELFLNVVEILDKVDRKSIINNWARPFRNNGNGSGENCSEDIGTRFNAASMDAQQKWILLNLWMESIFLVPWHRSCQVSHRWLWRWHAQQIAYRHGLDSWTRRIMDVIEWLTVDAPHGPGPGQGSHHTHAGWIRGESVLHVLDLLLDQDAQQKGGIFAWCCWAMPTSPCSVRLMTQTTCRSAEGWLHCDLQLSTQMDGSSRATIESHIAPCCVVGCLPPMDRVTTNDPVAPWQKPHQFIWIGLDIGDNCPCQHHGGLPLLKLRHWLVDARQHHHRSIENGLRGWRVWQGLSTQNFWLVVGIVIMAL